MLQAPWSRAVMLLLSFQTPKTAEDTQHVQLAVTEPQIETVSQSFQ